MFRGRCSCAYGHLWDIIISYYWHVFSTLLLHQGRVLHLCKCKSETCAHCTYIFCNGCQESHRNLRGTLERVLRTPRMQKWVNLISQTPDQSPIMQKMFAWWLYSLGWSVVISLNYRSRYEIGQIILLFCVPEQECKTKS